MKPLYDAVRKYAKVKGRFHMPSHGGFHRALFRAERGRLYASSAFDVTELSFSDNLASPGGVILQAEKEAARCYGAERTLFFAGGATDAVDAALLVFRDRKIAFLGDMHKSFHAAVELYGLRVLYAPSLSSLEKEEFGLLCVTSPDYYGVVRDLPEIAAFCKRKKAALLCDEAHGAHFAFSPLLPESAVRQADLVVHGMHKTLPVYTGGALLHVKEEYYDRAVAARAKCISTSPSYLVMSSMDFARDLFERKGKGYYERIKKKIEKLKKKYPSVSLLPADDFTRLTILAENRGIALSSYMERKGIYAEAASANRVTLIVTPFNRRYLDRAFRLASSFRGENPKYADLSELIGKISANDVGVYPPGVPVVRAGEVISESAARILEANLDRLFGTVGGKIKTK